MLFLYLQAGYCYIQSTNASESTHFATEYEICHNRKLGALIGDSRIVLDSLRQNGIT